MTKKRKSLDDSLASEFVFGGEQPETEVTPTPEVTGETSPNIVSKTNAPIEPKSEVKLSTSSSLMDKLQVEAKEGTKRFTIDLRESVHRKLSILSARTGRSKADIIRMVLDDVLKDVEE